jgi:hypothetical protein
VFLNRFDALISRINFKKHYFNVFLSGKHFETQLLLHSKTGSEKRHWILTPFLFLRNFLCENISTLPYVICVLRVTWVSSGFHFLFFFYFWNWFCFSISSFNIRLLAMNFMISFTFLFIGLSQFYIIVYELVRLTHFFLTFFNWFFFNLPYII